MGQMGTWAFLALAGHCLLQRRTGCSSNLCFLDDLPDHCRVSMAATHTAFAFIFPAPFANFAVIFFASWKSTLKQRGKSRSQMGTWAWLGLAAHCLVQIRTGWSSMLCFSDDHPASCLGSDPQSARNFRYAFAPCCPIANITVNWKFKGSSGEIFSVEWFHCGRVAPRHFLRLDWVTWKGPKRMLLEQSIMGCKNIS